MLQIFYRYINRIFGRIMTENAVSLHKVHNSATNIDNKKIPETNGFGDLFA